jgi:hypothetical protein
MLSDKVPNRGTRIPTQVRPAALSIEMEDYLCRDRSGYCTNPSQFRPNKDHGCRLCLSVCEANAPSRVSSHPGR